MTPRRYAILCAVLAVPATLIATQLYFAYRFRGFPINFVAMLLVQLMHWELWAVAAPVVWRLERRWPLAPPHRGAALLRHGGAALTIAAIVLVAYYGLYHAVLRIPATSAWFRGLDNSPWSTAMFFVVTFFHLEVILYAAVLALAHASRTSELLRAREHEALRLQAELTGARLTALRTQLQPHFLFNTLHTIGSLVLQRQNERAVQLLAELGELLRSTLAHRDTDLTPLRDEMAYLRRYLRIEEARFGDRLRVEWDVEPASEDTLIPPFILQPVVENALRHGIARRPEESVLRITTRMEDGALRIAIYNDGPPLAETFTVAAGNGYGLKNVAERLRTRKPAGRLELANAASGVRATLVVPVWGAP